MSYKETFRMNQRDFDEENQEAIKETEFEGMPFSLGGPTAQA